VALVWRFGPREREIALRCLAHVGLLERTWQRADTLSGGEQQRVAIAKILAQSPELILADEPIASLDVANATAVMDMLRGVATDTGLTVITTLHQVDAARRYADRILGFCEGQLIFDGVPPDLGPEALHRIFGRATPDRPEPSAVEAIGAPQWALSS
jgi:phosphonate transport system ATP-binding protein